MFNCTQGEEGCQTCQDSIMKFFKFRLTEASLEDQIEFLSSKVCDKYYIPEDCAKGVQNWWEILAERLYSENEATTLCNALDEQCELNK